MVRWNRPMMNLHELRQLYDQEQRIDFESPGVERHITKEIIRETYPQLDLRWVIYSNLTDANAEQVVRAEIEDAKANQQSFEWKVYSHDTPSNLKDILTRYGFEADEEESIMVLDLEDKPPILSHDVPTTIRRVTSTDEIDDMIRMQQVVWDEDLSYLGNELKYTFEMHPDNLSLYVAIVDEQIVSNAWIRYTNKSQFASLWGGSTLPDYRKRGFYSALLAIRAQEARERSKRFLTVDASPMSRPILERFGFHEICKSTGMQYTVS